MDLRNGFGLMILAAALPLPFSGCAAHRAEGRRQGPMRPPGYDTPTIGTDRSTVPRGRTIPPAGLGVDLVRHPSGARADDALTTTSATDASRSGPRTD